MRRSLHSDWYLGLHTDRSVSRLLRSVRYARIPGPVYRRIAVLEAAVRLAYDRRPHFAPGSDREAIPEREASERTRRQRQHSRGHVRLRPFAVRWHERVVDARPGAGLGPRRQRQLHRVVRSSRCSLLKSSQSNRKISPAACSIEGLSCPRRGPAPRPPPPRPRRHLRSPGGGRPDPVRRATHRARRGRSRDRRLHRQSCCEKGPATPRRTLPLLMTRVLLLDSPHTLLQARLPYGPRRPRAPWPEPRCRFRPLPAVLTEGSPRIAAKCASNAAVPIA